VRFRDLRAKALSGEASRSITGSATRAAGHTSVATTEGYIRGYDVKDTNLGWSLPKPKKAV